MLDLEGQPSTVAVNRQEYDPLTGVTQILNSITVGKYDVVITTGPSFASRKLSSLRTGIMAGSPCPIEVMRKVISQMGAREVTIAYGQTEASPVITQTRTNDPLELRVETVGRPLPGVTRVGSRPSRAAEPAGAVGAPSSGPARPACRG